MYATTIIPPVVPVETYDQKMQRLESELDRAKQLATIARQQKEYFTGMSYTERDYWAMQERSRLMDIQAIEAELRWMSQTREPERYASEIENARREDAECVGASNGAVNWEDA